MLKKQKLGDDASADEMLLDDPFEHRRIAPAVPGAFRIHDGNRSAVADPQAVRFRPKDAALFGEIELFQPFLQVIPGREAAFLVAALRVRLVGGTPVQEFLITSRPL